MLSVLALLGWMWMAPGCETGFCRCVPPRPVAEARAQAAAVFTGTVVSVRPGSLDAGDVDPQRTRQVVLRVHDAWKGVSGDTVVVATSVSMCGLRFEPGNAYLVYASPWGDAQLMTSMCSRTRALGQAAADLHELGEPAWRSARAADERVEP